MTDTTSRLAHSADKGILIGARTVMDAATASRVIEAGAELDVSPPLDRAIVETANRRGAVVWPGVMTSAEAGETAQE
jgi:2-keto-3-deoxy-6-phosphogluconate aldolase